MSAVMQVHEATAALRRAAVRATLAPSVHNTQPWRIELRPNELTIIADRTRQLRVLDPTGRQLMISCGCAIFNVRVALAAAGFTAVVDRFPDPADPNVLARITTGAVIGGVVDPIAALDNVVELRQTNRRRFSDDDVPPELVDSLEMAAELEDSHVFVVRTEDHRLAVARLSQEADRRQILNPAYRAEMRAWTTDDLRRRDGVPAMAVPHVDGESHDEVPIRDFDSHGMGWLPTETHSSHQQCLLLLGTRNDHPDGWLRAGEALERMLLEITRRGFVASPLTQVVEVPSTRAQLRAELGLATFPVVLLRVGRAPITPGSRRRRLVDVLVEKP